MQGEFAGIDFFWIKVWATDAPRLSSGLGILIGGRFIISGFYIVFGEQFLNFSFRKKSCKRNFLFASLVKTSAVFLKRVLASALPFRQVIRQTPVGLAPAE
jgi:hypothetical protein